MNKAQYHTEDLKKDLANPRFKKLYDDQLRNLRLGVKIAKLRQKLGWSQADLAHRARTSQQAISRIEDANYTRYSLPLLQKLASTMGRHLIIDLR